MAQNNIEQYQRRQKASSAVGVPQQDQSGQIIAQGAQSLASGIISMGDEFEKASEIFAVGIANEHINDRNKQVAAIRTQTMNEFADNPDGFQKAFSDKVKLLDDSKRLTITNKRALRKFNRYIDKAQAEIEIKAQEELFKRIVEQNKVTSEKSIIEAYDGVPLPEDAKSFESFITLIDQIHNNTTLSKKHKYYLGSDEVYTKAKAARENAIKNAMSNMIFEDPIQARKALESTNVTGDNAFKPADILEYKKQADAAIINQEQKRKINRTVQASAVFKDLDLNSVAGAVEKLDDLRSELNMYEALNKRDGGIYKTQVEDLTKLTSDLQDAVNTVTDKKTMSSLKQTDTVNAIDPEKSSMRAEGYALAATSALTSLYKDGNVKKGQLENKGIDVSKAFDNVRQVYFDLHTSYQAGEITYSDYQMTKSGIDSIFVNTSMLLEQAGKYKEVNESKVLDLNAFSKLLKDQVGMDKALESIVTQQAHMSGKGGARYAADLAQARTIAREELGRILGSEQYNKDLQDAINKGSNDPDLGLFREVNRKAVLSAVSKGLTRANFVNAAPGGRVPGSVMRVGEVDYRISPKEDIYGNFLVVPLPKGDADQKAIAKVTEEEFAEKVARVLSALRN